MLSQEIYVYLEGKYNPINQLSRLQSERHNKKQELYLNNIIISALSIFSFAIGMGKKINLHQSMET